MGRRDGGLLSGGTGGIDVWNAEYGLPRLSSRGLSWADVELAERAGLGLGAEMLDLLAQVPNPVAHVAGELARARSALRRGELTSHPE